MDMEEFRVAKAREMFVEAGVSIKEICQLLSFGEMALSRIVSARDWRGERKAFLAKKFMAKDEDGIFAEAEELAEVRSRSLGLIRKCLSDVEAGLVKVDAKLLVALTGLFEKVDKLTALAEGKANSKNVRAVKEIQGMTVEEFNKHVSQIMQRVN